MEQFRNGGFEVDLFGEREAPTTCGGQPADSEPFGVCAWDGLRFFHIYDEPQFLYVLKGGVESSGCVYLRFSPNHPVVYVGDNWDAGLVEYAERVSE